MTALDARRHGEAPVISRHAHVKTGFRGKRPIVTRIEQASAIARDVRVQLLRYDESPRDLAGQCGLAALLMAVAIGDPRTLRTGFYMKFERLFGKQGRYPHPHAWCRVGTMIVDATATQFDCSNSAVHVIRHDADPRYIETACGADAIDDIMINWCGRELEAYVQLAKGLRRLLQERTP